MLQILKKIIAAPVFEDDEDKTLVASHLNAFLLAGIALLFISRLTSITKETTLWAFFSDPVSIMVYATLVSLVVSRLRYTKAASLILLLVAWAALFLQASRGGLTDSAFFGLIVVIVLAGLLLGFRMSIFFAGLSIAGGWGLAYLQMTGQLIPRLDPPFNLARDLTTIFSLVTVVSYLTISSMRAALERSRNEEKLLAENQINLEKRVAERTAELERAYQTNQERAGQLRVIAEISQTFTSLKNINDLLNEITAQISRVLGFYHVGIYLLDSKGEFAVLRATNSQGGKRLLAEGHRIKVGQIGIVGYVTSTGRPRIALDVGKDAVFFDLPELAETRSEMALPLRIGGTTIGALDVQSAESAAFTDEDIDTLSLLAGQIAISIQNARLFEETRQALAEAQATYIQSSRAGWQDITRRGSLGYRFSNGTIETFKEQPAESLGTGKVSGKLAADSKTAALEVLAVPINIRGEELGSLKIRQPGRKVAWSDSEIRLYTSIVERLSSALENARLVEETNNRAERDRTITYISDKLGASTRVEAILRTAAEELSRVISGSEVLIQLQTGAAQDQEPAANLQ